MEQKDYINKANKLLESGFFINGYGHFSISIQEVALILRLLEENKLELLRPLYKILAEERLK